MFFMFPCRETEKRSGQAGGSRLGCTYKQISVRRCSRRKLLVDHKKERGLRFSLLMIEELGQQEAKCPRQLNREKISAQVSLFPHSAFVTHCIDPEETSFVSM